MKNQNEFWKDIPNYKGLYKVSNLGRVKSLERKIMRRNGRVQTVAEKILKNKETKYLSVSLCKDNNVKTAHIHKLVAMAFLGHVPNGHKLVVDHIDNDRLNNNVDNLQLISHRENSSKDKTGTSKYTGVSWNKIGYFYTESAAAEAYQNELKKQC
jgi:hypothetical protein